MNLGHRHTWETSNVIQVPAAWANVTNLRGKRITTEMVLELMTPHIYVTLRCTRCGDLKEKHMHGKSKI